MRYCCCSAGGFARENSKQKRGSACISSVVQADVGPRPYIDRPARCSTVVDYFRCCVAAAPLFVLCRLVSLSGVGLVFFAGGALSDEVAARFVTPVLKLSSALRATLSSKAAAEAYVVVESSFEVFAAWPGAGVAGTEKLEGPLAVVGRPLAIVG